MIRIFSTLAVLASLLMVTNLILGLGIGGINRSKEEGTFAEYEAVVRELAAVKNLSLGDPVEIEQLKKKTG